MSKNSIVPIILIFLLAAGITLAATRTFVNNARSTTTTPPLPGAGSETHVVLGPATVTALDALNRRFGGEGFANIDASQLPRGMDPCKADELLAPAVARLNRTLEASNAGSNFVLPPPLSGDSLFDRYALAMDDVVSSSTCRDIVSCIPPVVPDDILAEWTVEFGDDPRYWELRYISKLLGGVPRGSEDCPGENEVIRREVENRHTAIGFLHEARNREVASTNTLLLLYGEELYSTWLQEKLPEAPGPQLTRVELDGLLEGCLALEPDNAWAWYLKAFQLFDEEKITAALSAMETGNSQPAFIHPQPFPVPELLAGLNEQVPRGGVVVAGAGLVLSRDFPITYLRLLKDNLGLTFSYIDKTGDLNPLGTWHRFSCRYAECWPEDPLMPLIGMSFVSRVGEYMAQHLEGDDDPRDDVLRLMFAARNEVRREMEYCNDDSELREDIAVLRLVGGARGSCLAQYLQSERQARHLATNVLPVVADIATVDYPELLASASLAPYRSID